VQTTPPSGGKIRNLIGKKLKELRKQCTPPVTQDQLSGRLAKLGIQLDRVAIAKIETGRRCVFDFELKAIADALEIDPAVLLATAVGEPAPTRAKSAR
jgi:hypothetical protein